jgi:succinyl-diaminopimelate desuccinylase
MPTVKLAQLLIQQASLTPEDEGCQTILGQILHEHGFVNQCLSKNDVTNLFSTHSNSHAEKNTGPVLLFAGHTDVVPAGPLKKWKHSPFSGTIEKDILHGRGAADMKGALAAMITAGTQFVEQYPHHKGTLAFMITSDEEGPAHDGSQHMVDVLMKQKQKIDYCVIGEASSEEKLGDQIRHGRRGSLSAYITIKGKQGHVAYPEKSINPIHHALPALDELTHTQWDDGTDHFPPTSMQITGLDIKDFAINVVPDTLKVSLNFRYSPASSVEQLESMLNTILSKHSLKFLIDWQHSGEPFYTKPGTLTRTATQCIHEFCGLKPRLSVGGGTSDGRFIAKMGAEIIELGVSNNLIHQTNECVSCEDLKVLTKIYHAMMVALLT